MQSVKIVTFHVRWGSRAPPQPQLLKRAWDLQG